MLPWKLAIYVKPQCGCKSVYLYCFLTFLFITAFCYVARGSKSTGCNAKEGNPFGPFWDTFDIDFVGSEFYNPLHYDVHHSNMVEQWNSKYNPSDWPGK